MFDWQTKNLKEEGEQYSAGLPRRPRIVVDRNLYTGQNPASAGPLAQELLKAIR